MISTEMCKTKTVNHTLKVEKEFRIGNYLTQVKRLSFSTSPHHSSHCLSPQFPYRWSFLKGHHRLCLILQAYIRWQHVQTFCSGVANPSVNNRSQRHTRNCRCWNLHKAQSAGVIQQVQYHLWKGWIDVDLGREPSSDFAYPFLPQMQPDIMSYSTSLCNLLEV